MSDVRALLDDVTTRQGTHPDPVAAVHARVRRRAARRRSAVAAGTTFVVVAGGAGYATRSAPPPSGPLSTLSPSPSLTASTGGHREPPGPQWRLRSAAGTPQMDAEVADAVAEVWHYVSDRPEVFAYFDVWNIEGKWTALVGVGGDQDAALWQQRLARLAGDALPLRYERCTLPAGDYDRMKDEIETAVWPSGNVLNELELIADPKFGPCVILVETVGNNDGAVDDAYAKERWGDHVGMIGPSSLIPIGTASPTTMPIR